MVEVHVTSIRLLQGVRERPMSDHGRPGHVLVGTQRIDEGLLVNAQAS